MSRHHKQTSHGHGIRLIPGCGYRLSWTVDRYYADSRLRHPATYRRFTDEDGARRFAARWKITFPEKPKTDSTVAATPT